MVVAGVLFRTKFEYDSAGHLRRPAYSHRFQSTYTYDASEVFTAEILR